MDILNKLGNKEASAEGAATAAPNQQAENSASEELGRGEDMLGRVGSQANGSDTNAASASQISADDSLQSKKTSSGQEEPSGSETVKDPNNWTKDSALKEIKKLRDENKVSRIKYTEQLEKFRADQDARDDARKVELVDALKAKEELDKIKAEQEDKKRGIEEKLAHREAKLSELQMLAESRERDYHKKMQEMEDRLSSFEAARQAELQVQKSRLDNELGKIPEQYREHAELIVKGAGDPRDALVALHEAKLKGMFEDATVIVDHSVPGAKDGARSSKEKLETADSERRKSMSSSQKIKSALDAMKQGQTNSAFRRK